MNNSVFVGLAGDYTSRETEPSHYATKVGGLAWLPGHQLAESKDAAMHPDLSCLVCKGKLSLVVQASAPLAQSHDRVLLLFGCCAPGCGSKAGSWRAFCCQLPLPSKDQEGLADALDSRGRQGGSRQNEREHKELVCSSDDPLGFGDHDDQTFFSNLPSEKDNGASSSGCFDFSDLDTALDKSGTCSGSLSTSKAHKHKGGKVNVETLLGASTYTPSFTLECRWPVLPEFLLVAEEEPEGDEKVAKREMDHVQDLLAKYQVEENGELEELVESQKGEMDEENEAVATSSSQSVQGKEKEALSWAGEEYEEDQVKGVLPSYLKFANRLQRVPEQCVRYCHGGRVLWPSPFSPEPGLCPRCGSPRVFEMQLMPPLMSIILEASEAVEVDDGAEGKASRGPCSAPVASQLAINGAGNWDVCTVAVFTCTSSCSKGVGDGSKGCHMVEEAAFVVLEADCHADS